MTEGIVYNPIGTVEVTFDDTTYKLGRPKMRHFKHFSESLQRVTAELTADLGKLTQELSVAQEKYGDDEDAPEARAEIERLRAELKVLTTKPLYEKAMAITAEMFAQLGDKPLPEDQEDWPVWLAADASVPGEILKHWRTNPKASGQTPTM